jgi:hypothetical protein
VLLPNEVIEIYFDGCCLSVGKGGIVRAYELIVQLHRITQFHYNDGKPLLMLCEALMGQSALTDTHKSILVKLA